MLFVFLKSRPYGRGYSLAPAVVGSGFWTFEWSNPAWGKLKIVNPSRLEVRAPASGPGRSAAEPWDRGNFLLYEARPMGGRQQPLRFFSQKCQQMSFEEELSRLLKAHPIKGTGEAD